MTQKQKLAKQIKTLTKTIKNYKKGGKKNITKNQQKAKLQTLKKLYVEEKRKTELKKELEHLKGLKRQNVRTKKRQATIKKQIKRHIENQKEIRAKTKVEKIKLKDLQPQKIEKPKQPKTKKIQEPKLDLTELQEKYRGLFEGKDTFNRGIKEALQQAGYDLSNPDSINNKSLLQKIDKLLNVKGLEWNDVVDIIEHDYQDDIETLFYESQENRGKAPFDKSYFEKSLGEILTKIDSAGYSKAY